MGAAAVALGVVCAWRLAWLCDDAFISFRYADNLLHGLGLVYNAGERVEGYSNFLWTVFTTLGMRLGATPEAWTMAWGVAFYAGTIALLCFRRRAPGSVPRGAIGLPLAGLVAATHHEWSVFATSGLETSCFTFLVTLAYVCAVDAGIPAWAAGAVAGLLALSRPDGIVFAPFLALYVAFARPRRLAAGLAFVGALLALVIPYAAWKTAYYGDWLPNTYYAKSAARAWWSQGWLYARLYFTRYWPLAMGMPLALVAWWRGPRPSRDAAAGSAGPGAEITLAAVLALVFTVYVVRVGGDFMFARVLIPVTPLYAIVLEGALLRLLGGRRGTEAAVAAGLVAALAFTPSPFVGRAPIGGIVDEPAFYPAEELADVRREGATLRRYFDGLPVRIAIVGSQARLAYYSRAPEVIEAQTGLTDHWLARQPLAQRGRIGHEKIAPVSYLIERRVDFAFDRVAQVELDLARHIPVAMIAFDDVPGYMIHWNGPLLAQLGQRGARYVDFPRWLDENSPSLAALTATNRQAQYDHVRAFYFDFARDSLRQARWEPPRAP